MFCKPKSGEIKMFCKPKTGEIKMFCETSVNLNLLVTIKMIILTLFQQGLDNDIFNVQ